ncbi:ribosomal-protein-alanine N-acetyltransferase [Oikeobacillus pervagus]|uniref:[Ribosomal protein bS18]-alanine N-acetyltransferase n=1 Tax=Oikeobacillus pervagus TaxID=1325931 RepID=A0AAJ1T490_9BACI|nr:ribosomal protein S18-alanine N-acetyltransferase [Oikeobacillus pervagus]MDQ0216472.1 ribosomal-protein-alanine N-acetyltransferase [Oikeobacillus pervagus]
MNDVRFRYMTVEDVEQIMVVEHQSFTLPWTKESFYYELMENKFATYIVVEVEGQVVGYCGVWVVIDESHITNIAILPEFRGMGLGESLLRNVMFVSKRMGGKTMTLEVRVSNKAAQSLYKKLGFKQVGVRKNYYSDNQEDAFIMWVSL